jgi:hypothetical protein
MKRVFVVLSLMALVPVGHVDCAEPTVEPSEGCRSVTLEVVTTTMTQIVLQWTAGPANRSAFQLQRATDLSFTENVKTYPVDKGTLLFSDTDRDPFSKRRFMPHRSGPILDPKTTYYYRVKADLAEGGVIFSNTVSAGVSGPVRGKEGDLWADVVLGKPNFGENVCYHPTKHGLCFPGGVLIDKTVKPNRMYIADCNNNRILGFKSTSPRDGADIVLGQPDFGSSAGNGDSCAQQFPYRGNASAATLCLTLPTQISIGETVVKAGMALDEKGNLYVADVFNNRVLKYNDPFGTDTKADEVWGQADFTGNEPNRGRPAPANNTFKFNDCTGITLGLDGSLWVADGENNRVLCFPKNKETGVIAKEADLVLGQPDFTSRGDNGYKRTLAQLWYPVGIRFDSKGILYVSDGITNHSDGRILVFKPPFKSGMAATRRMPVPMPEIPLDQERRQSVIVGSIVRDINPDRMWFENGQNTGASELVDLRDDKILTSVPCDQSSGIDVDSDGNLYTVNKWGGIYRYPSSSWSLPWDERRKLVEPVLVKANSPTADSTAGILGITTFQDQLLIAENSRLLIWNKFDVNKITSGQPADDMYGEKDFATIPFQGIYLSSPQVDKSGRLWVSKRGRGHALEAFQYPLTRKSKPMKTVPLVGDNEDVLPVVGRGGMHAEWADFLDFAVVGSGDKIWVADRNASRVFRINNVDGLEDPKRGPYVDIILGQNNLTDTKRQQGKAQCGPRTLAWAYNVGISPEGELLISDNGGECGSNRRIFIYRPWRFPPKPEKCLFADDIGDPDKVIGTGGRLDVPGNATNDPTCSPFQVGISPRGTLVAGMNAYDGQRFPLVYLDPKKSTQPQMALGDMTGYPTTCFIDKDGNVYIGDYDWARVLIYKKPFKNIRY